MKITRLFALLVPVMLALPVGAAAQEPDPLSRLDPTSRYAIEVMMDSAGRVGLPPEALLSKTLEGIRKGHPSARVVQVVRRYFGLLRDARTALGSEATLDELTAAAGALLAGVDQQSLIKLRSSRKNRSILTPLVVLADLVSRGVPSTDASSAIIRWVQNGAADSDFMGLWKGVEQDIISGAPPAAALDRRAR
ncbi:MAG: hypothetical protein M3282_00535, partial [Gemmatimonadota bacterium]|nr:hypothetical protein [Gemmatimonadota bacterium]